MTRTEFIDLLDAYWNAAYHEGEAAATTDTPDGRAGKINSALMREYDALAARLAHAEACLAEKHLRLAEAEALLRELDDCGAIANWMRVSADLRARIVAFRAPDSADEPLCRHGRPLNQDCYACNDEGPTAHVTANQPEAVIK